MRARGAIVASCAGAIALALSAPATVHAQTAPSGPGFQLDRYVLPMSASDLFWVERPVVAPSMRPGIVAALGYQHDPLRDSGAEGAPAVRDDVRSHLAASIGLFNFLQVGLALPVVLLSTGNGPQSGSGPGSYASAFGDLRLDLRMHVLGRAFGPGARLALAGSVNFPTGNRQAYAGDGSVTTGGRILAEVETHGGFRVVANAGVLFRPTIETPGYTVGNEVFARFGVLFPLTRARELQATLEATATTSIAHESTFLAANYTSVEVFTGAKYTTDSGTVLGAGAGLGLISSVGTPDVRILLSIGRGYAEPAASGVRPGDDDRDGVLNEDDRCPSVPMGARPDPGRRGCPSNDADRDGYVDAVDNCPDVSAGARPDFEHPGCPLPDEDGDGLVGAEDVCPDVPPGREPDPDRSGCPLPDPDGDGVVGAHDLCPDVPRGDRPDAARAGCPDPDRDGDGVANERDACPDDPALRADDGGCPRWVRAHDGRLLVLGAVTFRPGRANVTAGALPVLDELALWLAAHPDARIRIEGRVSARDDAARPGLARARAEAVRAWLVTRGAAPSQLEAAAGRAGDALADEGSAAGRAQNRRVDFAPIADAVGGGPAHTPEGGTLGDGAAAPNAVNEGDDASALDGATRPSPPDPPGNAAPRAPSARAARR